MASKALVVGAYQRKLAAIADHPEVERLVAVVPPAWQEPGGRRLRLERLEPPHPKVHLRVEPLAFNGSFHLFFWPTLGRVLRDTRPDVVHLDEEPYNLATALGALQARRRGVPIVFFTWQNLLRRYPPPFSLFERYVYRAASHAIAGNAEARDVLRAKGYRGPVAVIPQFGVDPALFAPGPRPRSDTPTIGFVARLVREKGIFVLLQALARVERPWRLHVVASGPAESDARAMARALGIEPRVTWQAGVPSADMPQVLRRFDVLALPSLTRPGWKEQFGRVLVEAMACGVPVVGSDSGEIPNVVGEAGVIVPEGDPDALAAALMGLLDDPARRAQLAQQGRARVLERFTYTHIAEQTVSVYQALLADQDAASITRRAGAPRARRGRP